MNHDKNHKLPEGLVSPPSATESPSDTVSGTNGSHGTPGHAQFQAAGAFGHGHNPYNPFFGFNLPNTNGPSTSGPAFWSAPVNATPQFFNINGPPPATGGAGTQFAGTSGVPGWPAAMDPAPQFFNFNGLPPMTDGAGAQFQGSQQFMMPNVAPANGNSSFNATVQGPPHFMMPLPNGGYNPFIQNPPMPNLFTTNDNAAMLFAGPQLAIPQDVRMSIEAELARQSAMATQHRDSLQMMNPAPHPAPHHQGSPDVIPIPPDAHANLLAPRQNQRRRRRDAPCQVCGDLAHYGCHGIRDCCHACANFANRLRRPGAIISLQCRKGTGDCPPNRLKTHHGCRGCRAKACIRAGLMLDPVKPRAPKLKKEEPEEPEEEPQPQNPLYQLKLKREPEPEPEN